METFGTLTKGATKLIKYLAAYLAGEDAASLSAQEEIGAQLSSRGPTPPFATLFLLSKGGPHLHPVRSPDGQGPLSRAP
eukprot:CAMPEP_0174891632 /NCGR_PEP_ID=MMETSP0167-20121228/6699_1 /TAXON_ID=38298 /ORGANISM="Rhodella maculata, Strain CCMP736" /LENGTH=78 /DNA_ID=CAMNT_0016129887 /DNA_START=267 /DNA_END=504 /DNA_ORIENTATION=-